MARRYATVAGRRYPLKTATERAGASGTSNIRITMPSVATVRSSPGRLADTAVDSPAGSILVMMFLLAMLDFVRADFQWTPFTKRRVGGYFIAGFGFLLLATVAPELARAIVFGILLLTVLGMAGPVTAFISDVAARLNERPATTAPRPA